MRPATRRLTAQRKFAQGAFVPPTVAPAPSFASTFPNGAAERRDVLSTSQDRRSLHLNDMAVENMLDVVCFQNSHTHYQPIVLVQRLPEPNDPKLRVNGLRVNGISMNECLASNVRHKVKIPPRPRTKNLDKNVHVMRLRPRSSIRQTSRMKNSILTNYRGKYVSASSRSKRATLSKPRSSKSASSRALSTRPSSSTRSSSRASSFIPTVNTRKSSQKKRRNEMVEFSQPLPPKKKRVRPRYPTPSSDFSVDDNRPLKYLANLERNSQTTHTQHKPTSGPIRTNEDVTLDPTRHSVSNVSSMVETVIIPRIDSPPAQLASNRSFMANDQIHETFDPTLNGPHDPITDASPPTTQSLNVRPANNIFPRLHNYYSEQGIHRWMDGSLSEKQISSPHACEADALTETIVIEDDEIKQEYDETYECPARTWRTVDDVVNLSKADYALKCRVCMHCERIQKYENFCVMLKNKYNIKDNVDNSWAATEAPNWNPICMQRELYSTTVDGDPASSQAKDVIMFMDMIPRHAHVMIKCVLQNVDGANSLYAYLIPKSQAKVSEEFSFIEHEIIVDKLIEELTPSVRKDPLQESFMDVDDVIEQSLQNPEVEPVAGPSGLQNGHDKSNADGNDDDNDSCLNDEGKILNAPTYYPTPEEFADPMTYLETIMQQASDYGICKIVPPSGFAPPCKIEDDIKFQVSNQYISRLYYRWGPSAREMCAIKTCLREQKVIFGKPPMIDGIEVNLPKLYHLVQRYGGLENVINKNRWGKVADDMNLNKGPSTEKKLDQIYVTFILPYDTLTTAERQDLLVRVEKAWNKRNNRMLEHANNPLHRYKRLLGESDTSSDESDEDPTKDVEECVESGQNMVLGKFKRVAKNAQHQFFRNKAAHPAQVEDEYWRMVILGTEHICVNTASIDTGEQGLGFSTTRNDGYNHHKWNLKMLSQNKANVLRALGPVLGVTVPTLHLGMIFSTSCWHRDPHAVPWIEFSHMGPAKLWYSVPEKEDANFRAASKTLNPTSCQNKDLWLSSDISMIPPYLLRRHNVKVYRVEQNPGEYILVMPRAYSCSISTGFTVSESVYFATERLLDGLINAFQEIRKSCEPAMFALEQLLKAIADDRINSMSLLKKIQPVLVNIVIEELEYRKKLKISGIKIVKPTREEEATTSKGKKGKSTTPKPPAYNIREQDECDICRRTLFLSKVKNLRQKSVLCLEHTLTLMSNRKKMIFAIDLEMHYFFETEDLKCLITNLRQRVA